MKNSLSLSVRGVAALALTACVVGDDAALEAAPPLEVALAGADVRDVAVSAAAAGRTGAWWCTNHFGANLGGTWDCRDVSGGQSCSATAAQGSIVRCQRRGPADTSLSIGANSAPGRTGSWWCANHFGANLGGTWDCLQTSVAGSSCAVTVPANGTVLCRKRDTEIWMGPSHVTAAGPVISDFEAAFTTRAGEWAQVRKQLTGLKVYTATLAASSRTFLRDTVGVKLRQWGLGLSVEIAGATGYGCNSDRDAIRNQELAGLDQLVADGVPVRALVFDSPLWIFVAGDPNADTSPCLVGSPPHVRNVDDAIADIVSYVRLLRAHAPGVRIGLTDPLPNRYDDPCTAGGNVACEATNLQRTMTIYSKLGAALVAAGQRLDFVQVDFPNNYRAGLGFSDWRFLARFEDRVRYELGVQVQLITNDQAGGSTSGAAFATGTLAMTTGVLDGGGRPDGFVVQSWYPYPSTILAETTVGSHAKVTLDLARAAAARPVAP